MPPAVDSAIRVAAIAEVQTGAGIRETAHKYGLNHTTVSRWVAGSSIAPVVSAQQRVDVGELLFAYIGANLEALAAQARFVSDPAWLATQNAADLAILHGVMPDRSARLLAALQRGNTDDDVD